METVAYLGFSFGIIAFVFSINALSRVGRLEKRLQALEASEE